MAQPVTSSNEDGILVLRVSHPPVNALSAAVRAGLRDGLAAALEDPSVRAVVIAAEGRTFIAGADITEFGKPRQPPRLGEVIDAIEASPKPVVAAIHATALGGGLEVAMGCHGRVAAPGAKLGLPEVKLGILPGAGGTQRLPRLVGAARAARMMTSGEPVAAAEALSLGLVDAVEPGDLLAAARRRALELAADPAGLPRTRARDDRLGAQAEFEAEAGAILKRNADNPPVAAILRCIAGCFDRPFDAGLALEAEESAKLHADPRSKAMQHVFFAERAAARVPGIGRDVAPRPVRRAAVIGAGTMGGGIAMCFANAGIEVTVIEMAPEPLERGLGRVTANYDTSVRRGSTSQADRDARLGRIVGRVGLEAAAGADVIVEAVFEEMPVKKEIFAALDRIARPGAILATNTSYLDVNEIASATSRPADVLGMHFFSPANVMRLLEVVRGARTAPDALATAMELGRRLGKVPVVSGVCHGFIGNRMLSRRTQQAERLLLEGALPEQVDAALTAFGFRMGPFAMGDLAGLDIGWRIRKATGARAPIADALCEAGRFGQKTGKGYYDYAGGGGRAGAPDPEVRALIERVSAEQGIARREIGQEEITERLVYPMINEGARILEEGIAYRPGDVDVVWIHGYNWPAWRGGPMFHADRVGLDRIAERLRLYAERTGNDTLRPAPLLERLAREGRGFESMEKTAA